MKPVKEEYYTVPNGGQPVKTLVEWKREAIRSILVPWKNKSFPDLPTDVMNPLIVELMAESEALVEILSQTEKGRPRGSKTKKKAVVAVVPTPPAA